jgi:hypothetical protein
LSETSDNLNHWHNCSLNRAEMSPQFKKLRHSLMAFNLRSKEWRFGLAGANVISGARLKRETILRG